MNISDPQSRKEIDALADEIKAIANSMYLELANSESNPSHLQIQLTPQNALQPAHTESIPVRYTTSYEPSIDINNIQSATRNLHPEIDNHHPDLTPKNFLKDLNIESSSKTPAITTTTMMTTTQHYHSEIPKSSVPSSSQDGIVSELEKLHSKIDGFLLNVTPSKTSATYLGNEYSFHHQQQPHIYSPQTKEFQTNLTVNTNFENLKSSPSTYDLISSHRNAQATPISDYQDKNVAVSFVQEKRTNWTPSPTPYDNQIVPADQKMITVQLERPLSSAVPTSQNLNIITSPTKKQGFDKNKLDNILQSINKRKQNSPTIAIATNLIASPTHSLSGQSKAVQDIFLISSGHQPASTSHAEAKDFVSFGAHKYGYDSSASAALNNSYQTPASQIGRDFAQLRIDSVKANQNETLITPTPFRVETAELSKKSASPELNSAGHRRIKSGIAPAPGYYSSTSNLYSLRPTITDYRLSTDYEIKKSHQFGGKTQNSPFHLRTFQIVEQQQSQLSQAQMQRILDNEEKLDRILGKSLTSSKSVNFIKRLPDTTGEQSFTNASPTKPIPPQLDVNERPFRSVTVEGAKRTTFGSISPNKYQAYNGERGTAKQEISIQRFGALKSPERRRFMNKTENVVV